MGSTRELESTLARPLGARGSRATVGSADPAAELTPTTAAVLAAIPAWWSAQAARAGLNGAWLDVHFALDTLPPLALAEAPPLEQQWGPLSAEEVGAAYVESLAAETRSRHGRHYTPHELASQLWNMTRTALGMRRGASLPLPGLIRDPACGAGALLLPALREHLRASADKDPRLVLSRIPWLLEGIDMDPAAVWVANVVFAAEMLPTFARIPEHLRQPLPKLARVGDGLDAEVRPARAVVMNPPYGRVRLTVPDRERFADVLYGHANLYGLFMAAASGSLDEDGVLSALVPTSFTAGRYFEPLRRRLTTSLRLREVAFVADRSGVFTSVLQETCLATFTRKRAQKTRISSVGSTLTYVATVKSPTGGAPWLLPRRSDLAPIAAAAAQLPLNLGAAGWRVSTGPLVWNRRRDDLHARPASGRLPIVWAADIDGGVLHRDQARAAHRYIALRSEADYKTLELGNPCILVQRTTAPEQSRRLVAVELTDAALAELGGGVVVENHVNVLRENEKEPLVSRSLLTRLLSTETLDKLVRCISGSVALSAYELESIPLPDAQTLALWEKLDASTLKQEVERTYLLSD
ncbi:N-6 DNA methylase [Microbacterium sp. cx-55]|nr:N-6 DNA methylase [Microbacterium sp. cx-55]